MTIAAKFDVGITKGPDGKHHVAINATCANMYATTVLVSSEEADGLAEYLGKAITEAAAAARRADSPLLLGRDVAAHLPAKR